MMGLVFCFRCLDGFIFFVVATHSNLTANTDPNLKYTTRCNISSTRITMIVQIQVKWTPKCSDINRQTLQQLPTVAGLVIRSVDFP